MPIISVAEAPTMEGIPSEQDARTAAGTATSTNASTEATGLETQLIFAHCKKQAIWLL